MERLGGQQLAESLLQRVYDADTGGVDIPVRQLIKSLNQVGAMAIHRVYYDGGIAGNKEIRKLLKEKPNGRFALLIRAVRNRRIRAGDYKHDTLDRMYGLK